MQGTMQDNESIVWTNPELRSRKISRWKRLLLHVQIPDEVFIIGISPGGMASAKNAFKSYQESKSYE
jgi:hypothetical protein